MAAPIGELEMSGMPLSAGLRAIQLSIFFDSYLGRHRAAARFTSARLVGHWHGVIRSLTFS